MDYSYLLDLAIILLCTKLLGLATRRVQMPQVVGALLAGLILGPAMFGILEETTFITSVAELGVIVLWLAPIPFLFLLSPHLRHIRLLPLLPKSRLHLYTLPLSLQFCCSSLFPFCCPDFLGYSFVYLSPLSSFSFIQESPG